MQVDETETCARRAIAQNRAWLGRFAKNTQAGKGGGCRKVIQGTTRRGRYVDPVRDPLKPALRTRRKALHDEQAG